MVAPSGLPFKYSPAEAEAVERAGLVHAVDSGNFYHLVSEVQVWRLGGDGGVC